MLFIKKLKRAVNITSNSHITVHDRARLCKAVLKYLSNDFKSTEYLITSGKSHKINSTDKELKYKQGLVILLTDAELGEALDYYFRKATLEIKDFLGKKSYESISEERSGELRYTGRILL